MIIVPSSPPEGHPHALLVGVVKDVGRQDLDRHAVEAWTMAGVNHPHTAMAEPAEDLVWAEGRAGAKGHGEDRIIPAVPAPWARRVARTYCSAEGRRSGVVSQRFSDGPTDDRQGGANRSLGRGVGGGCDEEARGAARGGSDME